MTKTKKKQWKKPTLTELTEEEVAAKGMYFSLSKARVEKKS